MKQSAPTDAVGDEESFYNGLHHFLNALAILASEAETQCAAIGDCNVAWELKDELLGGAYLLNRGLLQPSEEDAVREVLGAISAVEVDALPAGDGRATNLRAMHAPVWVPLRLLANTGLARLAAAGERAALYFGGAGDAI